LVRNSEKAWREEAAPELQEGKGKKQIIKKISMLTKKMSNFHFLTQIWPHNILKEILNLRIIQKFIQRLAKKKNPLSQLFIYLTSKK